jgi:hypothetical protein
MSEKEVTVFLKFRGTLLSNFLIDMSKTERGRVFPSFVHIPYSKQNDMDKVCWYQTGQLASLIFGES